MTKIGILTLGCRVNQYESQAIAEELENVGYSIVPFSEKCDVYIINTCTVTAESDRKSKQMISRALARKMQNDNIIVCAIGCYTQNKKQNSKENELFELGDIDIIGGNSLKAHIPQLLHEYISDKKRRINILENMDNVTDFEDISLKKSNNVRAYLKVQDGCNNFCSYCIVPIVRGRVRSKPLNIIKNDLIGLRNSGYDEVVFCGIEISAYNDNGSNIITLAQAAQELGFKRVRFGSLNPILFTEEFTCTLSQVDAVMPHFHLSVQSASPRILDAMKRGYSAAMLKKATENIYKYFKNVTLSCDLICGFPGENDEDFKLTKDFVSNNEIIHAHIFPYSKRDGTPAALFAEQVPSNIKKMRCAELCDAANKRTKEIFAKYSGKYATVLVENKKNGYWFGHTESFFPVALKGDYKPGEFIDVELSNEFDIISGELAFVIK